MKQEPCIRVRSGKKTKSYQVNVLFNDTRITRTFNATNYGSDKLALEAAKHFRDKTLYELRTGIVQKKNETTVEQMFEQFIESSPLSMKTKRKHRLLFNKYILHKDVMLQQLTKADIVEDLNRMVEVASDDTISKTLSIWRNDIIEPALMREIIMKDVALGIKKPDSHLIPKKKSHYTDRETVLKVEELIRRKVMNNYDARIAVFLIEVLYYTGMRPAEAIALTRSDIGRNHISINKEIGSSTDDVNVVRRCKTRDSVREIPIHPQLQPILDELLEYAHEDRLFLRDEGHYMNTDWLGNLIHRLCKNENIEFNLYRLRHNMATSLITNNVDQKTTIEILGHANYDMSLYYAQSNDELKKEALELIH